MPSALGLEYRFVCPSYQRSFQIGKFLKFFPEATVCIREVDFTAYSKIVPAEQLVVIDEPVFNYASTCNWIFRHFNEEILIIITDDVSAANCVVGRKQRKIENPEEIKQILLSSARVCKDLGIKMFSHLRTMTGLKFLSDNNPFALSGMTSSPYGFIGRPIMFDEKIVSRVDEDITLKILKDHRINFIELRYFFDHWPVFTGKGGMSDQRTSKTMENDKRLLKLKWGNLIEFTKKKSTENVTLKVSRKAAKGLVTS